MPRPANFACWEVSRKKPAHRQQLGRIPDSAEVSIFPEYQDLDGSRSAPGDFNVGYSRAPASPASHLVRSTRAQWHAERIAFSYPFV